MGSDCSKFCSKVRQHALDEVKARGRKTKDESFDLETDAFPMVCHNPQGLTLRGAGDPFDFGECSKACDSCGDYDGNEAMNRGPFKKYCTQFSARFGCPSTLSTGAIVGISIGVVLLIIAIVAAVVVFFILKKKKAPQVGGQPGMEASQHQGYPAQDQSIAAVQGGTPSQAQIPS